MIEIFLPFTLATFIILLPVDSVKSGGTLGGVDKYTFGNVSPGASTRYAAHLILVWLLTCAYALSALHSSLRLTEQ